MSAPVWRNRVVLTVSLVVAVSYTGIGMVVPVRLLYAQSHGASLAVIGAMASAFLLANFIFQYPTGWLADRWGRRPVMLCGLGAQVALAFAYLAITDPIAFVALRFIEGAVAASVLPSARALIADNAAPEEQGQAYGLFGACLNAGFLLGPALGGVIAGLGYASAFVGSGLLRLAALALVLLVVHDDRRGRQREGHAGRERRLPPATSRRALLAAPLVGAYILAAGDNLYFGFDLALMPLWLRGHLGATVTAIGLVYAVWAVPNILGAPLGGRLADRLRRSSLILVGGLLQAPLYVSYGLLTSLAPLVVLFALHGVVYALMQPAVDATLAAAAPPGLQARVQGLYSAVGLASAFVAANALTVLYGIDYRLPLFVMAAGFGLCVLVGGTLIRLAERHGGRTADATAAQHGVAR